ncbi:hypothetical protein ACLOJK_015828 [Asimina triloba]
MTHHRNMKRKGSKLRWMVLCSSKKCLRTDSNKDIEEIFKSKLATIIEEEPEMLDECELPATVNCVGPKREAKVKRGRWKAKCRFSSMGETYVRFMVGFASRGGFAALTSY